MIKPNFDIIVCTKWKKQNICCALSIGRELWEDKSVTEKEKVGMLGRDLWATLKDIDLTERKIKYINLQNKKFNEV